jgi:superfamily II DNA or RNA helicase
MTSLFVGYSWSRLVGADRDLLVRLDDELSFKNKSVQFQLSKFKKFVDMMERKYAMAGQDVPADMEEKHRRRYAELFEKLHVRCARWDGADLMIPTGLVPRVREFLANENLAFEVVDQRRAPEDRRSLTGWAPSRLRRPQEEALAAVKGLQLVNGKLPGVGLIKLPTGVGKSIVGAELIRHYGVPTLFLVPSTNLLKSMTKRFEDAFGKKNVRSYGGGKKQLGYVTVATYQSVNRADPGTFDYVQMVIADEVHHVGAETFFEAVVARIPNAYYRFGLTATEERADGGTILVEAGAGPIVYEFSVRDAIDAGYLARPQFIIYEVETTAGTYSKEQPGGKIQQVPVVPYDGSDTLTAYKNWVSGNDKLTQAVAALVQGLSADGSSVAVLVDLVEHGRKLQRLIPGSGFATGENPAGENDGLISSFNRRLLKTLIGTSTIGEGTDLVPVNYLFELQGGASAGATFQADGRALRNDEDENGVARKPAVTIIDFDFPRCRLLHRHAQAREKVHRQLGDVIRIKLL